MDLQIFPRTVQQETVEKLRAAIPERASPRMSDHVERLLDVLESVASVTFPVVAADPRDSLRLLTQRVGLLEERRLDLVELLARAEWIEKSKWSVEAHAAALRRDVEAFGSDREKLVAEMEALRAEVEKLRAALERERGAPPSLGRRLRRALFPRSSM